MGNSLSYLSKPDRSLRRQTHDANVSTSKLCFASFLKLFLTPANYKTSLQVFFEPHTAALTADEELGETGRRSGWVDGSADYFKLSGNVTVEPQQVNVNEGLLVLFEGSWTL